MIYGIGIDVVHAGRMKIIVGRWGERFLKRVFTDGEVTYCFRKKDPHLSLAVRFAAKEAFIKAIGAEIPVSFKDVEVVNSGTGKPSLVFSERIHTHFRDKKITSAHLSLSHDHEYGVASVVLEQQTLLCP